MFASVNDRATTNRLTAVTLPICSRTQQLNDSISRAKAASWGFGALGVGSVGVGSGRILARAASTELATAKMIAGKNQ